jgi:splicing factor 3B subunit 3
MSTCELTLCIADEFDAYIIVSFVNATLVLSIGETVEEVTDSGFLGTTPTLSCSQLGDDALVQVNSHDAHCEHAAGLC